MPDSPRINRREFLAAATLFGVLPAWAQGSSALTPSELAPLQRPAGFPLIDAHLHYAGEHPTVVQWMADNDVKLLNVAVAVQTDSWRGRADVYRRLAQQHPARYAWCTSFTQPAFGSDFSAAVYVARVLREFEQDFAAGALGCKLWKSVGMSIQKPDGTYLQMDDPVFDPIYGWLADRQRTLLVHIADPLSAWMPLDQRNLHRTYYERNPEWHMYGRKDRPHHSAIIAARDRVLARFPRLRVVGAHLGSMEYDLDALADRLDRYRNFVIDTSGNARIADLSQHGVEKVRAFFIKYQDRVMFGSDRSTQGQLKMEARELGRSLATIRESFQLGWDFYATDKTVVVNQHSCPGLSLPEAVVRKLFHGNARRWYPGL